MPLEETVPPSDLRAVMTAIVGFLHGSWPNAVAISPHNLDLRVSDRIFVEAALALQDEGAIMYEALLVGVSSRPCLRDAIVTRKGQLWLGTVNCL
ncbi:MAG TPA: hypothetical protein VF475_00505 [Sphingobium sp.]